ncbi:uncharacterized protein LOC144657739 [Oculina patagonica]
MESRIALPRTRKPPLRNGKMTSETLHFRRVARQVMLANMFTRKTAHYAKSLSSYKSTAAGSDQVAKRRERKQNMSEKPPMKRRGTPELFPMSEEMKQTVISLGRLDLLPGEERKLRGDSIDGNTRAEKSRASCKFREKTRQRIIHPQRFIRNVRSSLNNSKRVSENIVHCEEKPDDNAMEDDKKINNACSNTTEDKAKCANSTEESDAELITTKSNCNILSRPQTTHFHFTAKSGKNQHYSLNSNRPIYVTRYSDLGPFSTRRPAKITSQGIWPTNAFDATRMRTREHYFPKKIRSNTFNGKAWVANSEFFSEESEKNNEETLKTRRWKSVESLTREIEEKCLSWLENRYGITQ